MWKLPHIALMAHASKVMLKILQARLQQYVNHELPGVQAGFRKNKGTRDQIASNLLDHQKSKRVPENHLLLLCWLCQNLWLCGSQQIGKFLKRWEYQTILPAKYRATQLRICLKLFSPFCLKDAMDWLYPWTEQYVVAEVELKGLLKGSYLLLAIKTGFAQWLSGKESICNARDIGSIPGSGSCLGGEQGNPVRNSFLENPTVRGAWQATVHRITKSWTWLKLLSTYTSMHSNKDWTADIHMCKFQTPKSTYNMHSFTWSSTKKTK